MSSEARSTRFIHTSDWQLGMTRAFLSDEAAPRFAQARIDAIGRLGELAREHDAQFIVVAGDVFESNQLSRQTLVRALDALRALPVPVFLLPGNHDPLDGSSIFDAAEIVDAPPHVVVIRDTTALDVPGVEGVQVIGAPWPSKRPANDLCGDLVASLPEPGDGLRIVVAHGQVDALSPDQSRPDIIALDRLEAGISEGRVHYVALGDRHSVTDVGSTGRVWYSGAPVATDFDEVHPNKALLVELGGSDCGVTPLHVGRWRFIAEQRSLDGPEGVESLAEWLDQLPDKDTTIAKLGFEGSVNLATAAALDQVLESRRDSFASLERWRRKWDLAVVPDELDRDSVQLSGYAKAAWVDLVDQARTGDVEAEDALRLFYRLSRAGVR